MSRRLCLLLVALALAVTGCRVELRTEIAVRDDGTGEVAATVVADAEVLEAAPTLADDLALDDALAAGWTIDGPRLTPEGGLIVVARKPFGSLDEAAEVLAELSGPQGPFASLALTQDRAFATVETSFAGTGGLPGGLAAFGDSALENALGGTQPFAAAVGDRPLDEVLGISLTLLLPGAVSEASAAAEVAADGSAASYRIPVDGTTIDLATTAEQRDEEALAARRRQQLAVGALLLWLALVAGLGLWWYLRRRQTPPRGPDGGPDDPEPPAPPRRPPAVRDRPPRPTPQPVPAAGPLDPGPVPQPIDPGLAPVRPIDPGLAPRRPIDPGLAPVRPAEP